MEELANTGKNEMSTLDNLAMQAQMFIQNARMNLLQLGRVFTEAKPLVPHGEWEHWIKANTSLSKRSAEQYMQAYQEFGLNPQIAVLGTTKTLKLLPLAEEEREKLLTENDVAAMSTRELEEAIRKQKDNAAKEARAEFQGKLDSLNDEIELLKGQKCDYLHQIEELKMKLSDDTADHTGLQEEIRRLEAEIRERDGIIEEQQADYNRIQEELLNVKSTIAKGDAERIPSDQLTVDALAKAVRVFIGSVARMPHMSVAFSTMQHDQWTEYDELLRTVESWVKESRKALDTTAPGNMVLIAEGTVNKSVW